VKRNREAHAKFVTKGVLTRLALMFHAEPDSHFTGAQVTEILLRVITTIEHGTDDVQFIEPKKSQTLEAGT
jgi:hypothetical protein